MKWEEEEEYKMKPSACAMRFVEDSIASGSLPAMSYKIPPEDAFIKMEEELEDSKSLLRLTSLVDQANDPFLSQIQSEEDENSKSLLQQSLQSINDDRVQQATAENLIHCCTTCGKKTRKGWHLRLHNKIKHKPTPQDGPPRQYYSISRKHHSTTTHYICTVCEQLYKSKTGYLAHFKTTHKRRYIKRKRPFSFPSPTPRQVRGPYKRKSRSKASVSNDNQVAHNNNSVDQNSAADHTHKCLTCLKEYASRPSLLVHCNQKNHQIPALRRSPVKCKICAKSFRKIGHLLAHYRRKVHKPPAALPAALPTALPTALPEALPAPATQAPIEEEEGGPTVEGLPDPDDPKHHCNLCKLTFTQRDYFHAHLRMLHKMEFDVKPMVIVTKKKKNSIEAVPDPLDPNFFCYVCKKTYTSRSFYHLHLAASHNTTAKGSRILFPRKKKTALDTGNTDNAETNTTPINSNNTNAVISDAPNDQDNNVETSGYPDSVIALSGNDKRGSTVANRRTEAARGRKQRTKQMESKAVYDCKNCNKYVVGEKQYRGHLWSQHKIILPDPNNRDFYCNACIKTFGSKYSFHKHLEEDHSIVFPSATRSTENEKQTTKYTYSKHVAGSINPSPAAETIESPPKEVIDSTPDVTYEYDTELNQVICKVSRPQPVDSVRAIPGIPLQRKGNNQQPQQVQRLGNRRLALPAPKYTYGSHAKSRYLMPDK